MLDSGDIEHFAQEGMMMSRTVMENPRLHAHVAPFGNICGLSEFLRRQEAHVREHGAPAEFAHLTGREVTYISILKQLDILRLEPGKRRLFIEYFHPYYNLLKEGDQFDGQSGKTPNRRGLPDFDEAFALGNQLHRFFEGLKVDSTRTMFIDNIAPSNSAQLADLATQAGMGITQTILPFGVVLYDSRVDGVITGIRTGSLPGHPEWFDAKVNEGSLILDAQKLADEIANVARTRGYRVQGARGKIHFHDSEAIMLYDKYGQPSCEVFDLAYRRFMTWDNNADIEPFHAGIIILPESFRRQQQRVRRLSQLMGWHQNIVTILQD